MAAPRVPHGIRRLLREAVAILERGPGTQHDDRLACMGHSADWTAGYRAAMAANHGWRETWVMPKLRKALAYIDGDLSAKDIIVYGMGGEPPKEKRAKQ